MKSDEYTSMGGNLGSFQATHWTAIERARFGNDTCNINLVNDLLSTYWKPVYCYLRHKVYDNERAKDLTQGFFQEVVLGRKLIQHADRRKGRFRTLLLRALDRYLVSAYRKETASKRIPQDKLISLDTYNFPELPEATSNLNSEDIFHYTWVCELLDRLIEEVESECNHRGMLMHWDLFRDRVLSPIITCTEPPRLEDLCHKYSIASTAKASNMIFSVKRRFRTAMKRLICKSIASEEQIGEEMRELMEFLAKGRQYSQ